MLKFYEGDVDTPGAISITGGESEINFACFGFACSVVNNKQLSRRTLLACARKKAILSPRLHDTVTRKQTTCVSTFQKT